MWRLGSGILALLCWLLAAGPAAHAEKRVALVIGNAQYAHETHLNNPVNDAREVAAALKRIRFDDVDVVLDTDLIALQSALARFARKADAAELALIYYSGHGVEVDGRNYLIPVSARLIDAGDVDFEAVPLDLAIAAADRAGKVKILVLDACRNNPFRARMALRQGKRSVGRGFAPVAAAAHGMLVAYSARAGTEADDGPPGGTSPFTTAFLKFVEVPRIEVRLMLGRVRDEVVRTTGRQEPFTYGSLGGDEVFLNAAAPPPGLPKVPPPPKWDYGPPAPPETPKTRVVGFTYQTPPQEVDPGARIFRRHADNTWSNTYPSGHVARGMRIRARVVVSGCSGSVVGHDDEPEFALFIPDKGCPGMMARWRRGEGPWNILGPMQNVR